MDLIKSLRYNLLIGDINIDLWPPNDPAQRKDIKQLYEEYRSVMNELGMSQANFKPTRFQSGSNPSLLDHIFVSHPQKLDAVETKINIIADHCLVSAQYHSKMLISRPQFRRTRNHALINSDVLTEKISEKERHQRIFELEDPDKKAETMICKMNRIVEEIAPSKLFQTRGKHEPWATNETKELIAETEEQIEVAIRTKDIEEWRMFGSLRNQAYKFIEAVK